MADFGSPVAQNIDVNPNRGIQTISGMLNLQSQKLGIQQQQQQVGIGGAELQKQQQMMKERLAIQKMMQTGFDDQGNNIRDPATGEPSATRVLPALGRIAPLLGQGYAQTILETEKNKVGLQASIASLDAQERGMLMAPLQAASLDPEKSTAASVGAGIDNLVSAHPEMSNAANYIKGLLTHVDNVQDPKVKANLFNKLSASLQGGQPVQTQPTEGTVNTGAAQFQGAVAPAVAGGGFTPSTQVTNQIPPGYAVAQDQRTGNFYLYSQQHPNDVHPLGQGGGPASGPQNKQNPNAPPVMSPGEPATVSDIQKEVEGIRVAGTQIGTNRDINRRILSLVQQASTGPGTAFVHQAAAAAGLPAGASYQELNSFLDRQAAQAANAMGLPNTNMGLETSKQFTGNTQLNNKVIEDKTKFVDALNDAAQKYLAGANRAVGTGANPNYTAYQKFRSEWSQNFDPEVFSYEHAVKSGDKEEQHRIESDLGRRGMAELYQKRKALIGAVNGQ